MTGICTNCGSILALGVPCPRACEANILVGLAAPSPAVSVRQPLSLVAPPPSPEVAVETVTPAVSPTGKPVIDSQVLIKAAGALVGVAGVLMLSLPEHTVAYKVCAGIVTVGTVLGIYSPGARKKVA